MSGPRPTTPNMTELLAVLDNLKRTQKQIDHHILIVEARLNDLTTEESLAKDERG